MSYGGDRSRLATTPRKQYPRRADRRREAHRRLLTAVEQHLEQESFTELTVDKLVSMADISRSGFYIYFEDKNELLRALYHDVVEDLIKAAGTWWALPPDATKDQLREGFTILADAYRPHHKLMKAVAEVAGYDEAVRAEYEEMMGISVKQVTRHIREGQKTGFVRPELNASAVAGCLTWMTEQVLLRFVNPSTSAASAERHLNAMVDIYWITLYGGD